LHKLHCLCKGRFDLTHQT